MKSFITLLINFVLQNQWITINAEQVLGIAPCMYSGDFDPNGYFCPDTPMSIDKLPLQECTSLVYDGINMAADLTVNFTQVDENNVSALESSDKPLYLYYGYATLQAWAQAVDAENVPIELTKMREFLMDSKISGLVLKNLNYDYNDCNADFHFDPNFFKKLIEYITELKKIKSNLSIGLYVSASNMIYYSDKPNSPDWFDFTVLNDVMDNYIIGFNNFNPCNEFFKGGTVPMDDVLNHTHSLTTFEKALSCSTIAKDKMYLEFSASPTLNTTSAEHLPTCCVTYKKYCEADHYNIYFCADNADAFYKKGKFAKDIGAKGIVIKYIDTIDPTAKCDCDNKNEFITFTMMLHGFKCLEPITHCTKLNSVIHS
ncbi:uncharacterized protein LOC113558158 [Rhopalosiphum maidis]|uniref:uncharacterized protein LOC113558158 n=1 Tax=Rhopalosiphum maidis TaxID=43146 RepID=UPI000EFE9E41|nr:uncharacterized protein LOC113558158 [Rhopalosiphum maidis]